ncbi:DUF4169 family protein [Caulobacter sp. S45]|jgi:hypothetical protein|uniref:DUF4169 family protein n=1 Tax=Caulobacter sp. S45 TaxID=1641861 RepID=UPI00131C2A61|nr:DUF4169 family protein [Caulobacter sp. S45]
MAEPINLNKARKARVKAEDQARAAENRVKFGRTGAQKALDAARADQAKQRLDQMRRERD